MFLTCKITNLFQSFHKGIGNNKVSNTIPIPVFLRFGLVLAREELVRLLNLLTYPHSLRTRFKTYKKRGKLLMNSLRLCIKFSQTLSIILELILDEHKNVLLRFFSIACCSLYQVFQISFL